MSKYQLMMSCGAVVDNVVYMSSALMNGLFSYDLEKKSIRYLMPFTSELPCYVTHCGAVPFQNEVWFIPQHGENISIYDTCTNQIKLIKPLYTEKYQAPSDGVPSISYFYDKRGNSKLYLLPAAIDALDIIDLESKQIDAIYGVIKQGESLIAGIYHKGVIYAFTSDGKWRVDIDVDNKKVNRHPGFGKAVLDIKWIEKTKTFLMTTADDVMMVAEKSLIQRTGNNSVDKILDVEHKYGYASIYGDYIFLFPWKDHYIGKIDINTLETSEIDIGKSNGVLYFKPADAGKFIIGVSENLPLLLKIDKDTMAIETIEMDIDFSVIIEKVHEKGIKRQDVFWNNDLSIVSEKMIDIDDFVRLFV